MNIAIVSIWFRRGQTYVALQTREALKKAGHNVHVFARTQMHGGIKMMDTSDELKVDNFTVYPQYVIHPDDFKKYLTENNIEAVIFLEEQWQAGLAKVCNELNIFCANIVVWETFNGTDPQWKEHYNQFDALLFQIQSGLDNAQYLSYDNAHKIPWGIDLNFWHKSEEPVERKDDAIRFVHSAGWGGMHKRKQTDIVKETFQELGDVNAQLLIHIQDTVVNNQVTKNVEGNITTLRGNIERDVLRRFYQCSDVAIICSKWEGLGLNLLEPQGVGLPVITTDDPPMNEWITNNYNGFCCDVEKRVSYKGISIRGSHVSKESLKEKIRIYIDDRSVLKQHSKNARRNAKRELDWDKNGKEFVSIVEKLIAKKEEIAS